MYRALLAGLTGKLYLASICDVIDVERLVGHPDVDTLSSADATYQFWIAVSTHPKHNRVNRAATEIFYATSHLPASEAPLLRGTVLITARHAPSGQPCGLTDERIAWLADSGPHGGERRQLMRRCVRDLRAQLRAERDQVRH